MLNLRNAYRHFNNTHIDRLVPRSDALRRGRSHQCALSPAKMDNAPSVTVRPSATLSGGQRYCPKGKRRRLPTL
jgi:hypothetical protein